MSLSLTPSSSGSYSSPSFNVGQPGPAFTSGTYGAQPTTSSSTPEATATQFNSTQNAIPRAQCGYSPWMSFQAGANVDQGTDYSQLLSGDPTTWTSIYRSYTFQQAPNRYFGIIILFSLALFFLVFFVIWRIVYLCNSMVYGTIYRVDPQAIRARTRGRALICCQVFAGLLALGIIITGIIGAIYVQRNLATSLFLSLGKVEDFVSACLNQANQVSYYLQNTNINLQLINSTSNLQISFPEQSGTPTSSNGNSSTTSLSPDQSGFPPLTFSSGSGSSPSPSPSPSSSANTTTEAPPSSVVTPMENLQAIKSWIMAVPDSNAYSQAILSFQQDYNIIESNTQSLSVILQQSLYPNLANICNQSYYIGYGISTLYTMPPLVAYYGQATGSIAQSQSITSSSQIQPVVNASNYLDLGNKTLIIDNMYKATNYSQQFTRVNPLPVVNSALQNYTVQTGQAQDLIPNLAQYTGLIINPFIQYQPNQWIPGVIAFIQEQSNVPQEVMNEANQLYDIYNSVELLIAPQGGNLTQVFNMIGNLSLVLNNTELQDSINDYTVNASNIIQSWPDDIVNITQYFGGLDQSYQNLYNPYSALAQDISKSNGTGVVATTISMQDTISTAQQYSQIPQNLQPSVYQLGNQTNQLYDDLNESLLSLLQVQRNMNISAILLNSFDFSNNLNGSLLNYTSTMTAIGNRTTFLNYTYQYFVELSNSSSSSLNGTGQYVISTPAGQTTLASTNLAGGPTQISVGSVQASVAAYQKNSSNYNVLRNVSLVQLESTQNNFAWAQSTDRTRYILTVVIFSITCIGTLIVLVFLTCIMKIPLLIFTFLLIIALLVLTVVGWLYAGALALTTDICYQFNQALEGYVSENPTLQQFSTLITFYLTGSGSYDDGLLQGSGININSIQQTSQTSISYLSQLQNNSNLNANTSNLVQSSSAGLLGLQQSVSQFTSQASQNNFAAAYQYADNALCCQVMGQLGLLYFIIFLQALFLLVFLVVVFLVIIFVDVGIPQVRFRLNPGQNLRYRYNTIR